VEEATLDISGGGGGPRTLQEDTTSIARKYHNMVLGGKVRAAVHMVTDRGTGGTYRPFDLDSKSGRPVIDVRTVQALDRWRHPVASSEALDVLYRAMRPASYRYIAMAIEIASDSISFLY
jgi:hypothetical protein